MTTTYPAPTQKQIYLAIDDDPIRYYKLSQQLYHPLMVTCRHSELRYYMDNYSVQGILIDHDMPFGNGMMFANKLAECYSSKIPVIVTSHNPEGAEKIEELLVEYGFVCKRKPAVDSDAWVSTVIKFLHHHRPL
jgi:CheY-like chemotaxis protein